MSLTALPTELLDAIFDPLAACNSTLTALARTCASLSPSATRLLYRDVSVSAYARNFSVVGTLAARPELAGLVRSFAVTVDDANEDSHADLYKQLQRALRNMPRLAHLELNVHPDASWVVDGGAGGIEYAQLEHFATSFQLDTHLSSFLGRAPSLLSLQLSTPAHSVPHIPHSCVPALASYTGPACLLPLFAGRPLTALHLSGELSPEDVSRFAAPTGAPWREASAAHHKSPVRVLSALTSAAPAQMLEVLAAAFSDLVCLRLMTTSAFWDAPDMSFYSRIAETLSSLPSLSSFELSGMHWEHRPKSAPSLFAPSSGCVEKEWISPPVSPRIVEADPDQREFDFDEAFLEWSY
ncbi:hypothetical protein OBBRIDRAFT_723077 [Obba rivulosa]|uniref:F-box domain-containing protein n=1 Tax=Obba rivulosa TaxID=1052685 RepID=A0A8E2J473_9APHY|nr:hypothetical protein OBBRIDRAFT_723077 [Obba rivulosa]